MGFWDRDVENSFDRMFDMNRDGVLDPACKLRLNGTPVPLLRNGYSIFNGTKYR